MVSLRKQRGIFIVFEGLDGSGKSTQSKLLKQRLETEGHIVNFSTEPTKGPIGQLIRTALKGEKPFNEGSIATLFAADRLDHLLKEETGILDCVSRGEVVISDRYLLSSLAYNSLHNELDWVDEINRKALEIGLPDIQIYLDLSLKKCFERLDRRSEGTEIYETKDILKRVHLNYSSALNRPIWQNITTVVSTDLSIEECHEKIYKIVSDYMGRRS